MAVQSILTAIFLPLFLGHVWGFVIWVSGFTRSPWAALSLMQSLATTVIGIMMLRGYVGAIRGFSDVPGLWLLFAVAVNSGLARLYFVWWDQHETAKVRERSDHLRRSLGGDRKL